MKISLFFIIVFGLTFAYCDTVRPISEIMSTKFSDLTDKERELRKVHMQSVRQRLFGGNVVKANSQHGVIAIIDAQDKLPSKALEDIKTTLYKCEKFNYKIIKQEVGTEVCATVMASDMLVKANSQLAIVVVNDSKSPAMLIAPEDRWALVNVGKLDDGIPQGPLYERMFAARCRKEIIRAFSLLCGGGSSQFPNNVMGVANIRDLDSVKEFIPIDMQVRYVDYLSKIGVTPAYERTYRDAVIEGWAPDPTNDAQKAIWDKIHAMPTEPIKIKPETKPVKD